MTTEPADNGNHSCSISFYAYYILTVFFLMHVIFLDAMQYFILFLLNNDTSERTDQKCAR